MKFGVFDHTDCSGVPLADHFENRLKIAEVYDRCGIYGYHMAEHHCTPLGMASSPSVLLSAIAQRTRNLRFGPLVYLLPMHHPLRLIEDICMIDQMSKGRFMFGFGRGASPYELEKFGGDVEHVKAVYDESLDIIMKGLQSDRLDYQGHYYQFNDAPLFLKPYQQPHPQLWYGIVSPETADWAAENNVNLVTLSLREGARALTDRFRKAWAALGKPADALPLFGISRHVVVAPTDQEARTIAKRAYAHWRESFDWLWQHCGTTVFKERLGALYPPSWEEMEASANGCAGSPETVRRYVEAETRATNVNYMCSWFAFGDLTLEEVTRSVELFSQHVMPAFDDNAGSSGNDGQKSAAG